MHVRLPRRGRFIDEPGTGRGAADAVLLVGSGATRHTVRGLLTHADGAIVGTAVKRGGRTEAAVDRRRAAAFVRAARG